MYIKLFKMPSNDKKVINTASSRYYNKNKYKLRLIRHYHYIHDHHKDFDASIMLFNYYKNKLLEIKEMLKCIVK
jgi:hypothetical protein